MPRQGRELERLVAILEEILGPEGIAVTSPDRIRDRITGRMREIDVALRAGKDGPILAVCEVRDRAARADVTWVEQAVTRIADLEGVSKGILVSSSGFTPEAEKKAAAYGLDLHLISDVSVEEFRKWFRAGSVELIETTYALVGCDINLTDPDAMDYSASVKDLLAESGYDAPIFQRQSLPPLSPNQLCDEWWKRYHERVSQDVPADGKAVRVRGHMPFAVPEKSLRFDTDAGPTPVAAVWLLVEVVQTKSTVSPARVTRYIRDGEAAAESVEFELGEDVGSLSVHRRRGDESREVRLRPPEAPPSR